MGFAIVSDVDYKETNKGIVYSNVTLVS